MAEQPLTVSLPTPAHWPEEQHCPSWGFMGIDPPPRGWQQEPGLCARKGDPRVNSEEKPCFPGGHSSEKPGHLFPLEKQQQPLPHPRDCRLRCHHPKAVAKWTSRPREGRMAGSTGGVFLAVSAPEASREPGSLSVSEDRFLEPTLFYINAGFLTTNPFLLFETWRWL